MSSMCVLDFHGGNAGELLGLSTPHEMPLEDKTNDELLESGEIELDISVLLNQYSCDRHFCLTDIVQVVVTKYRTVFSKFFA